MGMYTDFCFDSELKKDTPEIVLDILNALMNENGNLSTMLLPNHPLFKAPRWQMLGWGDSYYFDAKPRRYFKRDRISGTWVLNIRCNFKNYDDEIEKFIDWIKPYLEKTQGDFLGFKRYEEEREPTLIFY